MKNPCCNHETCHGLAMRCHRVKIYVEACKEIGQNFLVPPSLKGNVGNGDVTEWYQRRVLTLSLEWECINIYASMR